MDEYEVAQRETVLPDQFASRLPELTLEGVRLLDEGREYGELVDELASALAKSKAPASTEELQELRTLLEATGGRTEYLDRIAVCGLRSCRRSLTQWGAQDGSIGAGRA